MVTTHLCGKLGILFGKTWTLDVRSPAEALRAININLKGKLFEYFANEGAKKYYKVAIQKKSNIINKEEIKNLSGSGDIYILPTIMGQSSGAGKIIAGIAIIAIAIAFPAAMTFIGGLFGATGPQAALAIGLLGASLVLGGVVQLLTPVPKIGENSGSDQKSSSIFQGNAATIVQGGSIPVVYGRMLVGPMPISISLTNSDQATTSSTTVGTVTRNDLPGGGYEYEPGVNN